MPPQPPVLRADPLHQSGQSSSPARELALIRTERLQLPVQIVQVQDGEVPGLRRLGPAWTRRAGENSGEQKNQQQGAKGEKSCLAWLLHRAKSSLFYNVPGR